MKKIILTAIITGFIFILLLNIFFPDWALQKRTDAGTPADVVKVETAYAVDTITISTRMRYEEKGTVEKRQKFLEIRTQKGIYYAKSINSSIEQMLLAEKPASRCSLEISLMPSGSKTKDYYIIQSYAVYMAWQPSNGS